MGEKVVDLFLDRYPSQFTGAWEVRVRAREPDRGQEEVFDQVKHGLREYLSANRADLVEASEYALERDGVKPELFYGYWSTASIQRAMRVLERDGRLAAQRGPRFGDFLYLLRNADEICCFPFCLFGD